MATGVKGEGVPVKKTPAAKTKAPEHALSHYEEFNRFLDSLFPWAGMRPFQFDWPSFGHLGPLFETRAPRVDLIDRDHEILLRAELPGVEKDDIEIELTETHIAIKAHQQSRSEEEEGEYHRCEIARGSFVRSMVLPHRVDAEQAKAGFKDGILEIHLPKVDKISRRKVNVD